MFDANAGVATQVSAPGQPVGAGTAGTATASASPGASGPANQMSVAHACLVLIVGAAAALVVIGVVFRRPIGES